MLRVFCPFSPGKGFFIAFIPVVLLEVIQVEMVLDI